MKKNYGITLIALVVTIVVLLILAGVSISMLTGDNGVITQAKNARTENRGASVEERRDLWKVNQESDKYISSNTAKTLEELLEELLEENLINEDEKQEIEDTGEITIGSRTIVFKEKIEQIDLEYYISSTNVNRNSSCK